MDEFNKTVDLSKKIKNPRANARKFVEDTVEEKPKKVIRKSTKNDKSSHGKAEEIDELFSEKSTEDKTKENLQNISKPSRDGDGDSFYRQVAVFLVLALVGVVVYFMFFNNKNNVVVNEQEAGTGWYSVKLIDNKVYYGQIDDTGAEPIMIKNVYYDYDQLRQEDVETGVKKETGSLRLVKRGKETHGPSGDMEVFREKILLMEPLKGESKVLKAILEYEK